MGEHADTTVGRHDTEEFLEGVPEHWWRFPPLRGALVSGVVLATTYGLDRLDLVPATVAVALYILAGLLGSWHWGPEALESLTRLRVNIDVLMLVATVGSAALGLWEEAAFLAFLYGGAEGLEEHTYDRTRGAIRELLDLAPKHATVVRDGHETVVAAEDLAVGDVMLVRPGESLATDGRIVSGTTSLEEAAVTGESIPTDKGHGDEVYAGTLNLTGAIEVEVTRAFSDNTLSQIIHLVEEAQDQKTSAQQLIDRFGATYSPAILAAAAALAAMPILFGGDPSVWVRRGVTLAVAGAPCALVMSTPVAVAAAIGSAGKRGLLIKGGVHLENLGRVRVVALDKTGTLTTGTPQVTDVVALHDEDPSEVLRLAAAVEASSEHPLARAIIERAHADGVEVLRATDFEALAGAGARGRVDGRDVYVGSVSLFTDLGVDVDHVEEFQAQGKTVVLVGHARDVMGLIALRDGYRPEAPAAIAALREVGFRDLVMLTGDNAGTADAIAGALGIDEVRAGLRPVDKSRVVDEMNRSRGPVAMVGDGINDAPALATATVGIAMGTAGTDAAIEAADVALLGDDLRMLPYAFSLGRRSRHIGRQNIAFSILVLVVLVPAAVAGWLSIVTAVFVHEVSEIMAVLNGLRARRAVYPGSES